MCCTLILGAGMLSACTKKPTVILDVPFMSQSPFAVWDPLHEEACEEMSLIMVHHFLSGKPLSPEDAETEVQEMVAWQTAHNYAVDVSVAELGAIAASIYGHSFRVLNDVTADMLRQELDLGNPVIIPAAGRALYNPNFRGEGPFYHMLVVTGYSEDGFFTNEPGSKKGGQYWYSTDVLMNALHDWTGVKQEIATGAKTALVIGL